MALPNTHLGPAVIASLLDGTKNLFFAGIGGISMNSLAHISALRGHRVSGYDRTPSPITAQLEEAGITVYYEADAAHVVDCDALIYTVAMPADNPEYAYAKTHGIPLISRADYLGYLMSGYACRIGVSGTHGKSTTTGMLARILTHADAHPTVLGGAILKETGTVDIIGGHELFVFEACEYMDSFLDFYPTIAVVLNVELDHPDYFHSLAQMRDSFTAFMNNTGADGVAVVNHSDPNCMDAVRGYCGRIVTFGRNDPDADYSSANEDFTDGYAAFDVVSHGDVLAHIHLRVPGEHSIADALASFAACMLAGIPANAIAAGLETYTGIARRMEKLGKTASGAVVYADYAHHPTEIASTLTGARKICRGRLHVVFQPHTYSRTAELFDSFVSALAGSSADAITLCAIYAARETNTSGVSSEALANAIRARGKACSVADDFSHAAAIAAQSTGEDDMIIVMGAGDVLAVASLLTNSCREP